MVHRTNGRVAAVCIKTAILDDRISDLRCAPPGQPGEDLTMDKPVRFRQILGIRFFVGNEEEAIDEISHGGLVVVPAAPALKNLAHDRQYRDSLLGADFAIADSTLMVVLWNLIQGDGIPKLSGIMYLRALIERAEFRRPGASFWVMPTPRSANRNVAWLRGKGIQIGRACSGESRER